MPNDSKPSHGQGTQASIGLIYDFRNIRLPFCDFFLFSTGLK